MENLIDCSRLQKLQLEVQAIRFIRVTGYPNSWTYFMELKLNGPADILIQKQHVSKEMKKVALYCPADTRKRRARGSNEIPYKVFYKELPL